MVSLEFLKRTLCSASPAAMRETFNFFAPSQMEG